MTKVPMIEAQHDTTVSDRPSGTWFMDPLIVLAKRKRLLILLPMGAGLLAAVISLIVPSLYKSTARLMPPQQGMSSSSAMLGQLGPLGPLVGLAGQNIGVRNASDLYIVMLRSDTVTGALINRFSLMNMYRTKRWVDAQRKLENFTDIAAGKEGVISISVTDRDSGRAAAMANAYIEELQKLTRTLAVTEAAKR